MRKLAGRKQIKIDIRQQQALVSFDNLNLPQSRALAIEQANTNTTRDATLLARARPRGTDMPERQLGRPGRIASGLIRGLVIYILLVLPGQP